MAPVAKVALITGGASGLGLAVATSLAKKGWKLSLCDMNEKAGKEAAAKLNATFHKTNVTDYGSLSTTFDKTFKEFGRIDFVFANAGIVERDNFYAVFPNTGPPPEPDQLSVDIDLKAVITTGYLAQHYMRQNPGGVGGSLVSTSSVGGIYPSPFCPMYAAAKHGVLGFTRSVAKHFFLHDKIRANAILPGTMKTGLLSEKEWENFGETEWTPIEKAVEVVEMLLDEEKMYWGKSVEISGTRHYFREQAEYCDPQMKAVMEATDIETVAK
ncbi:3-beta-hydroxysteroid dehydrogenase [Halenospora varia]|nr:3-beta-hydroxysteroid dehydrogenase [Halenospora varia]